MKVLVRFLLLLAVISGVTSCSKDKNVTKKKLPYKSTSFLLQQLQQNEAKCDWFTAKLGIEFKTDKMEDSFKMHVRLRKDSAIWISATYYSVEAARFLITADTVKFMDRKNNKYFIGDFSYINEKFDVELDFESLQSLILGNGAGIQSHEKLKTYPSNGLYHISSLGKRKMKKEKGEIGMNVILYPTSYKVAKLILQDFKLHKSLLAEFTKHQEVDEQLFPEEIKLNIVADQKLESTIEYLKITVDKPVKFSFTIPDKYERMD